MKNWVGNNIFNILVLRIYLFLAHKKHKYSFEIYLTKKELCGSSCSVWGTVEVNDKPPTVWGTVEVNNKPTYSLGYSRS